jgi:hypothetical protein
MTGVVESLEGRQLLAGSPYDAAFSISGVTSAIAGDVFKITRQDKNVGTTTMSNFSINSKLGIRLSKDQPPSLDDIKLVEAIPDSKIPQIGAVKPGQTFERTYTVKIPENTPAGDYYVTVFHEDSPSAQLGSRQQFDSNLSNNLAYYSIRVDAKPAPAPVQSNTSMKLVGRIPGGLRGKSTTFTIQLLDAQGQPIVGEKVDFTDNCKFYGTRKLGTLVTDSSGKATLKYTIPSNVNADNVSMTAKFAGNAKFKASSYTVAHVEIGRKN